MDLSLQRVQIWHIWTSTVKICKFTMNLFVITQLTVQCKRPQLASRIECE